MDPDPTAPAVPAAQTLGRLVVELPLRRCADPRRRGPRAYETAASDTNAARTPSAMNPPKPMAGYYADSSLHIG